MLLSTIHIVPTGPPIGKMTGDTLHAIFEDQNIDSWIDSMRSKEFLNTQQMFVEFKSYPYLDDLLIDPILIDHFEKFMVNWMELKQTSHIYTHFVFKIRSNDYAYLKDIGLIEWLEFIMLIAKGTRINITLLIDGQQFSKNTPPISCKITRDISDPRLNIGICGSLEPISLIPEDLGIYTILILGNKSDIEKTQLKLGAREQRFFASWK